MPNQTMYLRDLVGPYKGQVRPYLRHAGENAIASGFAELPDQTPDPEVRATPLPVSFPGRAELVDAGFETLEAVPTHPDDLKAIPGVGKRTAEKILEALQPGE